MFNMLSMGRVLLCLSLLLLSSCGGDMSSELQGFKGKVVFINYWAEWCKPCREEIPALNQFQSDYVDRVQVVGVNYDGASGEELSRQEEGLSIAFPTLINDPRPELGLAPAGTLPETLILNRNGEMVAVLRGEQTAESLLAALRSAEATESNDKK